MDFDRLNEDDKFQEVVKFYYAINNVDVKKYRTNCIYHARIQGEIHFLYDALVKWEEYKKELIKC